MTFDEWYYELEGFHLRCERFYADGGNKLLVEWLLAAYEVGLEEGRRNAAKNLQQE